MLWLYCNDLFLLYKYNKSEEKRERRVKVGHTARVYPGLTSMTVFGATAKSRILASNRRVVTIGYIMQNLTARSSASLFRKSPSYIPCHFIAFEGSRFDCRAR